MRGLLYEFGVVLPRGKHAGLKALGVHRAEIDAQVPETMRRLIDGQLGWRARGHRAAHRAARSRDWRSAIADGQGARAAPGTRHRPARRHGAGRALGDGRGWRSGREFSASLGLVPAHKGIGGKVRIGHLSKHGDPYLRTMLIHGARSVITHAKVKPEWLERLLARRPLNVAVAALANKMARTAWALVAHGRAYQPEWKSTPPKGCTAQTAVA